MLAPVLCCFLICTLIVTTSSQLLPQGSNVYVELKLSVGGKAAGSVGIALDNVRAPYATANFVALCKKKSTEGGYKGSIFHRLITEGIFILQGGDPTGTGMGGKSAAFLGGKSFKDENLAGAEYPAGTVAMANAGPNTNKSQFFIVYKDDSELPPLYSVFGRVTSKLDIIKNIAKSGTQDGSTDGKPKKTVTIVDCKSTVT